MFEAMRSRLLPLLRVPPEPTPPWGAPGSVRVFRAGRNFYRLRLIVWGTGQLATLVGIVISLHFLAEFRDDIERRKAQPATRAQQSAPADGQRSPEATLRRSEPPRYTFRNLPPPLEEQARRLARRTPWWLFPAIGLLEVGGILLYLAQLPVTYAIVRLEFEQRWYIVTDRSLRIRSGLVSVQEATMSFANIQQVTVTQGPLQRLLSIADVQVRSAGGGSGSEHDPTSKNDSMHVGVFHGVDNASEIRDLILERLREFRAVGLGDPDEHHEPVAPAAGSDAATPAALAAANEVLAEARALRLACESRGG